MSTQNRQPQGQPTGGQFAAKSFTEDDIELARTDARRASDASWQARKAEHLADARYVAISVLAERPTAAKLILEESDQEGCSWDLAQVLDADGNEVGNWEDFEDLASELWGLPTSEVLTADSGYIEPDHDFDFLTFTSRSRHSGYAELDLAKVLEITEPKTTNPENDR